MFACLHTLYFKVDTVWQMSLNYANKTQTQGLQWAQSLCTLAQLCLENAIHMPTEIGRCRTKKHMNVHSETFRWKMTSCVCEGGGGGLLCVFWICGRPYHLAEKTISHLPTVTWRASNMRPCAKFKRDFVSAPHTWNLAQLRALKQS